MVAGRYNKVSACDVWKALTVFSKGALLIDSMFFGALSAVIAFHALVNVGIPFAILANALWNCRKIKWIVYAIPACSIAEALLMLRVGVIRKSLPDFVSLWRWREIFCAGLRWGFFMFLATFFNPICWMAVLSICFRSWTAFEWQLEVMWFTAVGTLLSGFLHFSFLHSIVRRKPILVPDFVVMKCRRQAHKVPE